MVKLFFGKNKKVFITQKEFSELKATYGAKAVLDYIDRFDKHLTQTGKFYSSHYETIKAWLVKDGLGEQTTAHSVDNNITEILRAKYHRVLCKCGKKMKLVGFDGKKVDGLVPSAFYKCECGTNAYEKVYSNQEMVVVYFGENEKPSIKTLHDFAEIELLALNIEEMERLLNED